MKKILVIEDDRAIRENIIDLVEAEGFEGIQAADGQKGIEQALRTQPDLIICDIMMPELDGYGVLRAVRSNPELEAVPFIFVTAKAERGHMRTGMGLGADDYLTKPFTRAELLDAISTRLERQSVLSQRVVQTADVPGAGPRPISTPRATVREIVVRSAAMRALFDEAGRAAKANISVLILGETGVGKEVLAHHLHLKSPRASAPFVPLNCAALSPALLESELFGHEKGAFTGASQAQEGVFESAHGGSVFLDEIGELAPEMQVKLLRVLEERRVTRVGSRQQRDVDVRFISATNAAIDARVDGGDFRQDLFFRINGITLVIPPLRERLEEIEPLAQQFADAAARDLGRDVAPTMADDFHAALRAHRWPGNVRELRNAIERAVALCDGDTLLTQHLPASFRERPSEPPRSGTPMDQHRRESAERERTHIIKALEDCGQNQTKAAALLGMSRRTLVSRLDEYDIDRPRKK